MRVTPGVVLHKIGQLRQVFAWVSAINLTSNNRRSGKSDKRKPSWTALRKDECLPCCGILQKCFKVRILKNISNHENTMQKNQLKEEHV